MDVSENCLCFRLILLSLVATKYVTGYPVHLLALELLNSTMLSYLAGIFKI